MIKGAELFTKIKDFLIKQFGDQILEREEGHYLQIGDSSIWISGDENELIIGFRTYHRHFFFDFDDMRAAVENFFNLLSKNKQLTYYRKGKTMYKSVLAIENDKEEFEVFSIGYRLFYPYWKPAISQTEIISGIIEPNQIEECKNEILSFLNN